MLTSAPHNYATLFVNPDIQAQAQSSLSLSSSRQMSSKISLSAGEWVYHVSTRCMKCSDNMINTLVAAVVLATVTRVNNTCRCDVDVASAALHAHASIFESFAHIARLASFHMSVVLNSSAGVGTGEGEGV